MRIKQTLLLAMAIVLTVGLIGIGQTTVAPRVVPVNMLFFDNDTGGTVAKLGIIFTEPVPLQVSDIAIVFGEGEVTLLAVSNTYAFLDVVMQPGDTLLITLTGAYAGAEVHASYWFE